MLAATFTFLTPRAAFLCVLAVIPIAAVAIGRRRAERARRELRLPSPDRHDRLRRSALVTACVLLLVLAAMQPVVRTTTSLRARTDSQAFVVLDTSRSMAASPSPGGTTRLQAAKGIALSLGTRLPGIPLGVATFTDRVLPDLFPTSDSGVYDSVVDSATVEGPPPRDSNTVATTFGALTELATEGFFAPTAHRRAVVLITDGESRAFDPSSVAETLRGHGIQLAVVRVGSGADRVWRSDGTPEANFRPDPAGARISVSRLQQAASQAPGAGVASVVARALGRGPTSRVGVEPRDRTLSPIAALLALLPLAGLLAGISRESLRRVTFRRQAVSVQGVVE
jgi:hypothetical protein